MNYYIVDVEIGNTIDETTHCFQDVFYIHTSNDIDFDYVKRIVNNKFGLNYDTIDIVVERVANDTKLK